LKTAKWNIAFLAVVMSIVILLSACRPEPVAPQEAQVIILSPSAESTIYSDTVTLDIYVDNFVLTADDGRNNQNREGHLIYYKDVTPPLLKGKPALTEEGSYAISIEKSFSWNRLEEGPHNFWVQLVNNDNTTLEPPSAVRVPVTVVLK
jgi:hypothetical protein